MGNCGSRADGSCDPDPYAQGSARLGIIVAALRDAGAEPRHVIRTRAYLVDAAHGEAVGKAHAEFFGDIRLASTMVVVSGFLNERWKVEMEADAIIDRSDHVDVERGLTADE